MSIGAFAGWNHCPTDADVAEALGPRLADWQALTRSVRENYPVKEVWRFLYGDEYGWALCFEMQATQLAAFFPAQGGFTVQIDLDAPCVEKAQRMDLGHNTQQAIAQAYPHPEGRSLFIPAETESDSRDIRRLLALRTESNDDWLMMEKMMVQFVAGASHQIRTPFTIIIGYSKLLLDGEFGTLTDAQRESLTEIHRDGQRALALWNDFVDVYKLLSQKAPRLSFEEVDLRQLVENFATLAARHARYYGRRPDAVSNIEVVADEIPQVWGDAEMLKQAITWTLEEMIADRESKTLIKLAEDNGQARLEITATNCRMSQPNCMLYFSQRIIRLHSGDMQVKEWNEPEPGVMVTMTLPIHRA